MSFFSDVLLIKSLKNNVLIRIMQRNEIYVISHDKGEFELVVQYCYFPSNPIL